MRNLYPIRVVIDSVHYDCFVCLGQFACFENRQPQKIYFCGNAVLQLFFYVQNSFNGARLVFLPDTETDSVEAKA